MTEERPLTRQEAHLSIVQAKRVGDLDPWSMIDEARLIVETIERYLAGRGRQE